MDLNGSGPRTVGLRDQKGQNWGEFGCRGNFSCKAFKHSLDVAKKSERKFRILRALVFKKNDQDRVRPWKGDSKEKIRMEIR